MHHVGSNAPWSLLLILGVGGVAMFASACASKANGPNDFGDDASSSSGGGSGQTSGGSSSGSNSGSSSGSSSSGGSHGSSSSSGTSSSSGSSSSAGSSSGTHADSGVAPYDAGKPGPLPADASAPTIAPCGTNPMCDLRTQTCCVGEGPNNQPVSKCVNHGQACPLLYAAFNCEGESDCPAGQVCCGTATSTSASTKCATTCPTQGNAMSGTVQVCKGSAECQNKMQCIPQQCLGAANLDLCGLTSQPPFNCVQVN